MLGVSWCPLKPKNTNPHQEKKFYKDLKFDATYSTVQYSSGQEERIPNRTHLLLRIGFNVCGGSHNMGNNFRFYRRRFCLSKVSGRSPTVSIATGG